MNVGFFDGHVELMDDSDSANPHLWLPTGSTLETDLDGIWPDVVDRWGPGNEQPITIGECVWP